MIWRGASRAEWVGAVAVATISIASAGLLRMHAAELDAATEARRERIEKLDEVAASCAPAAPAMALDLALLFDGHLLVPENAPWGSMLALHSAPSREVRR